MVGLYVSNTSYGVLFNNYNMFCVFSKLVSAGDLQLHPSGRHSVHQPVYNSSQDLSRHETEHEEAAEDSGGARGHAEPQGAGAAAQTGSRQTSSHITYQL